MLHGADVSHEGAAQRARRGLGRTFQRTELFNSLTVRQNVAMGREAALAGANPLAQVFGSRQASRVVSSAADEALAVTGTARIADTQVGLAADRPAAPGGAGPGAGRPVRHAAAGRAVVGLDGHETEEFGRVLEAVVRERGCGILWSSTT